MCLQFTSDKTETMAVHEIVDRYTMRTYTHTLTQSQVLQVTDIAALRDILHPDLNCAVAQASMVHHVQTFVVT